MNRRPPWRHRRIVCSALLVTLLVACSRNASETSGGVSAQVALHHQAARAGVDLSDLASFADAGRGFIAAPTGQVRDADGQVVWDYDAFAFVKGDAPPTVNPSLWRQALLNNRTGLFKVAEGIWQLRGFDLARLGAIIIAIAVGCYCYRRYRVGPSVLGGANGAVTATAHCLLLIAHC